MRQAGFKKTLQIEQNKIQHLDYRKRMCSPTPPNQNEHAKSLNSSVHSTPRPASINELSTNKKFFPIIEEEDTIKTLSRPSSSRIAQIELKKLGSQCGSAEMDNHTNNIISYESGNEGDKEADNEISYSGNMMKQDSPGSKQSSIDHSRRSRKAEDCN